MHTHQLLHAQLQKRAGCVPQRHGVQRAVRATDGKARGLARLEFIENAVVCVRQNRRHNIREPVAVLAYAIDARLEAGLLRRRTQSRAARAVGFIRRVNGIEQQQIAEVKNLCLRFLEIQPLAFPERIRAATMEKGAAASVNLGHHIGVRGGRLGGHLDIPRVNLVPLEVSKNVFAQRVLAHEADGGKWKFRSQLGKVHHQIIGRAAGALTLAENVGQRFPLRKNIHHLHLVNNPVASGEDSTALDFTAHDKTSAKKEAATLTAAFLKCRA